MTTEQKAKAYDKALERAKQWCNAPNVDKIPTFANRVIKEIFPELSESEDERIRKSLIILLQHFCKGYRVPGLNFPVSYKDMLAWLEKQGKQTSWKPSKEEMDVLYGLAYITNQYDEHKEEVITRLYQDLKREFFNGSSYENMFPNTEDGVRRRSTIQVLEYARSLDTYNQYGKADIDKNIAWLEKQGEQEQDPCEHCKDKCLNCHNFPCIEKRAFEQGKSVFDVINEEKVDNANKVEPKFKVGDWCIDNEDGTIFQIVKVLDNTYIYKTNEGKEYSCTHYSLENDARLWSIQDAKDGDVLTTYTGRPFIFKGCLDERHPNSPVAYCGVNYDNCFFVSSGISWWTDENVYPATKEQRDTLMKAMADAGYTFDFEKKELKKIEQKPTQETKPFKVEHGKYYYCIKDYFCGGKKQASKGDVVQALRGLPIMGLKDASEYFLPVNLIKEIW